MKVASYICCITLTTGLLASCSGGSSNKATPTSDTIPAKKRMLAEKPGSTFNDTLRINKPSAVFYSPDSLQLDIMRRNSDEGVFEATMHEFDSQFRNGHKILKKEWPQISVVDARNIRFLEFIKKNGQKVLIDLDKKGDAYGLFIFDTKKDPEFTDMMNIDTRLYYYFSK